MKTTMMKMNFEIKAKHVLGLIVLSIAWGANYLFVKLAINGIDPISVMAIRGLSASVFLLIALPLMKKSLWQYCRNKKMQRTCFISGTLIAYMWFSMAKTETQLTASMTSLLIAFLPVFAWFIATFIYREKPFYIVNFVGIAIALIGLSIMIGINNITEGHDLWYVLLYTSGLFAFTISAAISGHTCRNYDAFVTVTFSVLCTTAWLCLAAITIGHPSTSHYTWSNVLSAIGTGIISTGIGYLIYFWLLTHAGQVFAASNGYLVPISGFIMGIVLLGEPGYWHQVIGLLIIFVGTYLTNKKIKATKEKAPILPAP